jgi:hypothetical protein
VFFEVEDSLGKEEFCWRFPSQRFSWSSIAQRCDLVQLQLRVAAEVFSFGQILTQQAVGIFVESLPGLIPRRLRRKVKSGFQDTSPLAARSFI